MTDSKSKNVLNCVLARRASLRSIAMYDVYMAYGESISNEEFLAKVEEWFHELLESEGDDLI